MGIIIAAVFFAIAIVVQSGIAGISMGITNALAGDWISLIAAFIQLILGIILAIVAIYIALNILDHLTKGIDGNNLFSNFDTLGCSQSGSRHLISVVWLSFRDGYW
jgi:hypothetical protein